MKSLVYIRMVLWSFLGIRRRAAAGQEIAAVKPLTLLATAVVLAATFVFILLAVVRLAIGALS